MGSSGRPGRRATPDPKHPYQWAMLYTHEIGHVLGMDHPTSARTCTAMNPSFFQVCPTGEAYVEDHMYFTCRILQQRDKQIRKLSIQLADLQREIDLCQRLLPQVRDMEEDLAEVLAQL